MSRRRDVDAATALPHAPDARSPAPLKSDDSFDGGDARPSGAAHPPRRRGRPPKTAPELAGLRAVDIARAIAGPDREPTASETRGIGYALSGTHDLGIARLDALLEARPELDARAVVRELAARMRARREP